uniref:Alpha putative n=1 Tax=Albugo laibachii Nc14 TaxID=890382 RepID=F0W2E9_9STRA|nr:alpha putative [Albugo laibachii Nc14]|eukprot:CCA15235.1 alpha putative [Albugo laibachii Nc14]
MTGALVENPIDTFAAKSMQRDENRCLSKDKEVALLRELSALYARLNQVREKRAKVEKETYRSNSGGTGSRRKRRILLVTRSLPFKLISEDAQSQWRAEFPENITVDGATETYMCLHENYNCIWIGSVHGEIEPSEQNTLREQLLQDRQYLPVFLDSKKERMFYHGFCKTVMWPILHSIPPSDEDHLQHHEESGMTMDSYSSTVASSSNGLQSASASKNGATKSAKGTNGNSNINDDGTWVGERSSLEKMWQAFVAVNQAFADAVQQVYEEGDLIWIQGYHLALLPQMIRNLFPNENVNIGMFLHTPFPSSELYRIMNNREEILSGILEANLIGFQTYEYARHFQSSAVRLLGLESSHKGVNFNGHFARVTICPVGIDAEKYITLVQSDAVQEQLKLAQDRFAGKKIILGVDQLDVSKGLIHKLLAIEELFTLRPELAREVVFLQIVTGSNSSVESAMLLGAQVEALVSRINSKLQDVGAEGPVQYLNQEISVEMLVALYCMANTLVVTPLRDGMNTVPFVYVACREGYGRHARVVLSEFAGCAQSLSGAIFVNPWNTEELHDALLKSLQDNDEVMRAHQNMYSYISTFTSRHWADNYLEQLRECYEENALAASGRELSRRDMTSAYLRSHRRLIFINYEGVLASEASIPELAYPPQELIWQLSMLTSDKRNTVVLVTSRSIAVCEQWFSTLSDNLVLAAEHGIYIKWCGKNEVWHCMVPNMDMSWWEHVIPLLEYYTERTPGAYIERKDSSVTWHYRDCDLDHGLWQASELLVSLREITRALPVSVVPGNRCLELRPQKVSKASLFERIWDFMNHAAHHPEDAIARTDYFGEAVAPSTPVLSRAIPRNASFPTTESFNDSIEDMSRVEREVKEHNRNSSRNRQEPVDFVLVIASGEDRMDEDLFAVLVPPPIDLEAYCKQLEKEEMANSTGDVHAFTTADLNDNANKENRRNHIEASSGDSACQNRYADSMRHNSENASSFFGTTAAESALKELSDSSSSQSMLSSDPNFLMLGENITTLAPLFTHSVVPKQSISDDAANMFPRTLLNSTTNARREEITEKSKFTPRRDFPPSAALFKAMKTKYGENFGMHRLPTTAAACWALVCPPNARAKLEDTDSDLNSAHSEEVARHAGSSEGGEGMHLSASPTAHTQSENEESRNHSNSHEDGRYRFPVNTFVCTLGRKLSQAPYYIKNSADLIQLLQEMGLNSHIRKQRMLAGDKE